MLKWWKRVLHQYPEFRWGRVLDPAGRKGELLSYLFLYHKCGNLWGIDKAKGWQADKGLKKLNSDKLLTGNYLSYDFKDLKFDTILATPPLPLTKDYIDKSLNLLSKDGILVIMQDYGWLQQVNDVQWFRTLPLARVIMVPKHLNNGQELFIHVMKNGFKGQPTIEWLGHVPHEFLLYPPKEPTKPIKKRFYFKLNKAKH